VPASAHRALMYDRTSDVEIRGFAGLLHRRCDALDRTGLQR